jgi:hypothetical protein
MYALTPGPSPSGEGKKIRDRFFKSLSGEGRKTLSGVFQVPLLRERDLG